MVMSFPVSVVTLNKVPSTVVLTETLLIAVMDKSPLLFDNSMDRDGKCVLIDENFIEYLIPEAGSPSVLSLFSTNSDRCFSSMHFSRSIICRFFTFYTPKACTNTNPGEIFGLDL